MTERLENLLVVLGHITTAHKEGHKSDAEIDAIIDEIFKELGIERPNKKKI